MKQFLLLGIAILCLNTVNADEQCNYYCTSHEAAHESFCEGLSRFSCETPSTLCYVYKYCPDQPPTEGHCYSHEAVHESFCGSLSRFSCETHSSLCYWAY